MAAVRAEILKSALAGTARHALVLAGATLAMVAVSAAVALISPGDGVDQVSWGVFVTAPAFTAAFLYAHLASSTRGLALRIAAMTLLPGAAAALAYVLRGLPGAAP